jgi:methionyl-tRNA formyltransferase
MNIIIFSTEDYHHTYFINKINNIYPINLVVYEKRRLEKEYNTSNPYQAEQDKFEKSYFFSKVPNEIDRKIKIINVKSINSKEVSEIALNFKYDVVIVFGCGKINEEIIRDYNNKIINIHRGLASKYRGLDSELWAIKNYDFESIGTTIHYIDKNLDTGDIVYQKRLTLRKDDQIYKLRAKTTELAVEGTLKFINDLILHKVVKSKQEKYGKYYSSMDLPGKKNCEKIFKNYIRNNCK